MKKPPQSGKPRARAAPQSGKPRARAAPQSGKPRARAAPQSGKPRARLVVLLVAGTAVLGIGVFTAYRTLQAAGDAMAAKRALLRAENRLAARDLDATRADLDDAQRSLRRMRAELDGLGPVLPVARLLPVAGSHVKAVERFHSAGVLLADAGLQLADAAQRVRETTAGDAPLSGALEKLRAINASVAVGAESVRAAAAEVRPLGGSWLLGPVASARDDLLERLGRYERQATSTAGGIEGLIRFAGGDGQRRYLFLSQNPDEIRPTGGFIGTYGLLTAAPEGLGLDRFADIQDFHARHPDAVVPGGETGSPFRFAVPPVPQRLSNVNSVADFPTAGKLAAQIWNGTGEPPIDGVVSFTPSFLARILGVVGPVTVPEYGETVGENNLVERFDFYTTQTITQPETKDARKGFVIALSEVVLQRVLDAPASQWERLGGALGDGFTAREAMVWAADPLVTAALADRGWDGVLPKVGGDFFYNAEFSYQAKFNRGLQREFDHHVRLEPDGSAHITTTMTVANNREPSGLNAGSLSYVTIYGPEGAVRLPSSDPPESDEPALAGHPAAGWFVNAPPLGKTTLTVAWDAEDVARKVDGERRYSLHWLGVPDHSGDVLKLRVDLPKGWEWKDGAPPPTMSLDDDVEQSWAIRD